jgi:hypothetical protein
VRHRIEHRLRRVRRRAAQLGQLQRAIRQQKFADEELNLKKLEATLDNLNRGAGSAVLEHAPPSVAPDNGAAAKLSFKRRVDPDAQDHTTRDSIRRQLAPYYSAIGRPSIDPELMIRMLLIGYCCGIRSERRLCEEERAAAKAAVAKGVPGASAVVSLAERAELARAHASGPLTRQAPRRV